MTQEVITLLKYFDIKGKKHTLFTQLKLGGKQVSLCLHNSHKKLTYIYDFLSGKCVGMFLE